MSKYDKIQLKKEVDESMKLAFSDSEGNASVAAAYWLEAIARMQYFELFGEPFDYEEE